MTSAFSHLGARTALKHISEIVGRSPFFGSLPRDVLQEILGQSDLKSIAAGGALFHQGDASTAIFCVVSGLVKLSIQQSDGAEAVIEVFQPGHSFAEALAFRAERYPASAIALVDSVVLAAPSTVLVDVFKNHPDAFPAILAGTYAHLHKLVRQIESLKANSGLARLIHYILAVTETADDTQSAELPFEKKVLASLLGMKAETLSRSFRRLEPHGVVVDGRRVTVKDRKALLRLLEN